VTAPRVSVVVPARNAESRLPRVLEALAGQTAMSDTFEVLVVDDRSTDRTPELVRASGVARHVGAPPSGRQAGARNRGASEAAADLLAFLDADCVPGPDWIERGLEAMDGSEADLLAGRIGMEVEGQLSPVDLVAVTHDFDQERYVAEGFAAGANLWVRREVFAALGGFDVRLAYDEDRELVRRATAGGAVLRYAPAVSVDHPRRGAPDLARRSYRTARSRARAGSLDLSSRLRGGSYAGPDYMRRRLADLGYPPTARQLVLLRLAKYACVRLPMLAGVAVGSAGRWWARSAES